MISHSKLNKAKSQYPMQKPTKNEGGIAKKHYTKNLFLMNFYSFESTVQKRNCNKSLFFDLTGHLSLKIKLKVLGNDILTVKIFKKWTPQ